VLAVVVFLCACASVGERHYGSGIQAYARGDLDTAIRNLWSFVNRDCYYDRRDERCHEAELDLARAFRRSGRPAWSLLVYDRMRNWQTVSEVLSVSQETDEAKAAVETLGAGRVVPAEIRFRHDANNSFRILYVLLYLDGKKVFDSREHATTVGLTAGWVPLFSGGLSDCEHAVVFKVDFVSRPAFLTRGPLLQTRNRIAGGQGKPILLDVITMAKPGTLTDDRSMAIAMGLRPLTSREPETAENPEAPTVVPGD
jgi:hypothetical protein